MLERPAFDIYQITDRVYLFLFGDSYDLCMHFLRYQESYESPKFRDTQFTILEFMDWYAKTYGKGVFTYTSDWGGFNIPSHVIWKVHSNKIQDYNRYDAAMLAAYNKVSSITHLSGGTRHDEFYILGASKKEISVLGHELSHGLYSTNEKFREDMDSCTAKLPTNVIKQVFDYLTRIGYSQNVLEDELQAYFSTGLTPPIKKFQKYAQPFQKVFKEHTKGIKFNPQTASPLRFK
jgi:hypothetical protein